MENTTNLCTFVINKVIFISCTFGVIIPRDISIILSLFYSKEYKPMKIQMRKVQFPNTFFTVDLNAISFDVTLRFVYVLPKFYTL